MTEREKLMDLIINAKRTDPETGSFSEWLVDFLLGYGVLVPMDDDSSAERLRELVEADKAGRCVVLPFKVGDVVYTNISVIGDRYKKSQMPYDVKVVFIGMGGGNTYFHVEYSNGRVFPFDLNAIGKTIFTTQEEAEVALEKMKEG